MRQFVESESSLLDGIENNVTSDDYDEDDDHRPIEFDESRFFSKLEGLMKQFANAKIEDSNVEKENEDENENDDDDDDDDDVAVADEMEEYAAQMDRELESTTMGKSFVRAPNAAQVRGKAKANNEDDNDDLPPVDINLNLVENLLESYRAQGGDVGPLTQMLAAQRRK